MKTEVTVVKCGSTTLGPVRLDQQTGSPCYGTIICILQLELSSLKHGLSTEHIPTAFEMSDSYVSSTESFLRMPVQSIPHLCNISLKESLMWFFYVLRHFQIVFCPDHSSGLHLACAIGQLDKQIHIRKRCCVCFSRANRLVRT
jgi:hypothetical protein